MRDVQRILVQDTIKAKSKLHSHFVNLPHNRIKYYGTKDLIKFPKITLVKMVIANRTAADKYFNKIIELTMELNYFKRGRKLQRR
jgi:hypothetical protein